MCFVTQLLAFFLEQEGKEEEEDEEREGGRKYDDKRLEFKKRNRICL